MTTILLILLLTSFFIIFKLWRQIYNLNNKFTKVMSLNDIKFLNYDSKITLITNESTKNSKKLYEAAKQLSSDEKHSKEDINTISKRITNLKHDVYWEIEKIKNDLRLRS